MESDESRLFGLRLGEVDLNDRLEQLDARSMRDGQVQEAPNGDDDEEDRELLERVMKESLEQKAKDDEMRRMAGAVPQEGTIDSNPDSIDDGQLIEVSNNENDLETWLNLEVSRRLGSVVDIGASYQPHEGMGTSRLTRKRNGEDNHDFPQNLTPDEQIKFFETYTRDVTDLVNKMKVSNKKVRKNVRSEEEGTMDEDEMLELALKLSLDPNEQVQAVNHTLEATGDASNFEEFEGAAALETPISASNSDRNLEQSDSSSSLKSQAELDADIVRAMEISRREHAKFRLRHQLHEDSLVDQIKRFKGQPRPIVVDGNNVAYNHSSHNFFSVKALVLVYDYFSKLGHNNITIFCKGNVKPVNDEDKEYLKNLIEAGLLKPIHGRKSGQEFISHYDDYFILKTAKENGGIVVTNDKFRDVIKDRPELSDTIKSSILPFQFVSDHFIPAEDPLGRFGPKLSNFLRF